MIRYRDVHGASHARPPGAAVEWRVSGYGVVLREGRLLVVEPVMEAGWTWGLPGGGIRRDPEERILDGIAREVHEETGYRFTPDPATLAFAAEVFYRTQRGRHLRSLLFTASGSVAAAPDPAWTPPADEIARVGWVEPARLRREEVQWQHWAILARLGLVADQR